MMIDVYVCVARIVIITIILPELIIYGCIGTCILINGICETDNRFM